MSEALSHLECPSSSASRKADAIARLDEIIATIKAIEERLPDLSLTSVLGLASQNAHMIRRMLDAENCPECDEACPLRSIDVYGLILSFARITRKAHPEIRIDFDVEPTLPCGIGHQDLLHAMSNLVANACEAHERNQTEHPRIGIDACQIRKEEGKFTFRGGATFFAPTKDPRIAELKDRDYLLIRISDNGKNPPSIETIQEIMDGNGKSSKTEDPGLHGHGLVNCANIIRNAGGTIIPSHTDSKKGLTFTLIIPCERENTTVAITPHLPVKVDDDIARAIGALHDFSHTIDFIARDISERAASVLLDVVKATVIDVQRALMGIERPLHEIDLRKLCEVIIGIFRKRQPFIRFNFNDEPATNGLNVQCRPLELKNFLIQALTIMCENLPATHADRTNQINVAFSQNDDRRGVTFEVNPNYPATHPEHVDTMFMALKPLEGGHLSVLPTGGNNYRVSLTLPAAKKRPNGASVETPLTGKVIIIVDDYADAREAASHQAKRSGAKEVHTFANSADFFGSIERILTENPDAIIYLDYNLVGSEENGVQIAARLREMEIGKNATIVLTSSQPAESLRVLMAEMDIPTVTVNYIYQNNDDPDEIKNPLIAALSPRNTANSELRN